MIGHVLAGGTGKVEVVDLVDNDELGPGLGEHVAHGIGDVCGVVTLSRRKSEEVGEL